MVQVAKVALPQPAARPGEARTSGGVAARTAGGPRRHVATPTRASFYDRRMLDDGIVSWVYGFSNREPRDHGGLASGLEIGVQLAGEWLHQGSRQGSALVRPGETHRLSVGERFRYRFRAEEARRPGLQVGFIVYPERSNCLGDVPGELFFPGDAGATDRRLHELARYFVAAVERDGARSLAIAHDEVLAYVRRHCEIAPPDPLLGVRREIDRNPAAGLYVHHLAEMAELAPATFVRRFKQRFGMTPIAYRLSSRLNVASHMSWSRPELSIREIAERAGFDDMPFFHRTFLRHFGVTPARYGRRTTEVRRETEAS